MRVCYGYAVLRYRDVWYLEHTKAVALAYVYCEAGWVMSSLVGPTRGSSTPT